MSGKEKRSFFSLYEMTLCALFASVVCVLSPFSVPIGVIPISLGLFGVLLAAAVLGSIRAAISVLVFILVGACGLPVFSSGMGGFSVLLGPTGGYIWGYIPAALIAGLGFRAEKPTNPKKNILVNLFSVGFCILGTLVCYLFGTVQYSLVSNVAIPAALVICVLPFIPFDLIKCVFAGLFGTHLRHLLFRAGLDRKRKGSVDKTAEEEHAEAKIYKK